MEILIICTISLVLSTLILAFLTPDIHTITFQHKKICIAPRDDSKDHHLSINVTACSKSEYDKQRQENQDKIEDRKELIQQIADTGYLSSINQIRFKVDVINKSFVVLEKITNPTNRIIESATISCQFDNQNVEIHQNDQFPAFSSNDKFVKPSDLQNFYGIIRQKITDKCSFQGTLDQNIEMRTATTTELSDKNGIFYIAPGEELNVGISEKYEIKLSPNRRTWVLLTGLFIVLLFVIWQKIKKYFSDSF